MFANLLQGNVENNMLGLLIIPLRDLAAKHPDWLKNLKAKVHILTSQWDNQHMPGHLLDIAKGAEKDHKVPGASLFSSLGKRSITEVRVHLGII